MVDSDLDRDDAAGDDQHGEEIDDHSAGVADTSSDPFFTADEDAAPPQQIAGTEREHQKKFRWWALGVIAALCVFFGLTTLLFAAHAPNKDAIQVASDMAKTSIPTLLTLLGTAVAWAFKSEKD
ncbi:hypothetical protein FHT44_006140 [Mycolicibacterium sp. BK634]|uniref:hypothetical protein n=1 Tax=Mycolicibacterium sp. BK634 TaxID=2587099 RepID=UPI00161A84BF|nr:hypothetical protein [Mycolicibacterium sp. BK634]MBB3753618.1 hypothetical protein [Mycolicibacterium sp. BK634]